MPSAIYRALVVDDDVAILKLICRELHKQGFVCDIAMDGDEALQLVGGSQYDIVVTDLKMPNMHGHALAHEMLQLKDRPLIVVHTGVIEPRLAKDLLMLGVDDIVFKPTDVSFLATKLKAMVERHHRPKRDLELCALLTQDVVNESVSVEDSTSAPISFSVLNLKLGQVSRILPISRTTFDLYEMTRNYECDLSEIAVAIRRDASLTAEVLRLANCSRCNPSGRRIVELDEAVFRIGQTRVGELALSASALSALAPGMLPWVDLELTWKRSMASGMALQSLVDLGGHQKIEVGLLLSAILHPLGRVVLGMLFPEHYEAMLKRCEQTGETLRQQERHMFPMSHTEIMGQLLAAWRIPPEHFVSLRLSLDDFSSISGLSEPTRTKTELVKTAVLLGWLAADGWESWDSVQFPTPGILKRLGVSDANEVVRQARSDVNKLAKFRAGGWSANQEAASPDSIHRIAYCNLSDNGEDFLAELLPAIGLQPRKCTPDELRDLEEPWIANCVGGAPTRFTASRSRKRAVVVTDQENRDRFDGFGATVVLPNSYAHVREALLSHLKAQEAEQARAITPSLA